MGVGRRMLEYLRGDRDFKASNRKNNFKTKVNKLKQRYPIVFKELSKRYI